MPLTVKVRKSRPAVHSWRGVIAGLLVVVAGLLLVRPGGQHPATPDRTPAAGNQAFAPAPGLKAALDFDIVLYQGETAIGGRQIRLSSLWGQGRPVVLNFWAGLCPPCRAEMPDFQWLYDEGVNNRFTLLGVDIGPFVGLGSQDDGRALLRELKITFPAGTTPNAQAVRAYQILGMPTTVFITPDSRIFRKHVGLLTSEQIHAFVAELLKASGAP